MNDDGMRMSDRDNSATVGNQPLAVRRVDLHVRSGRLPGADPARPVVVVLGMHRSGTSLLSNVLQILGVDMADTTDHISPKNAGGFWERPELNSIQDEILAAVGRPIAQPSHVLPFPPAWWRSKEVQALKPKLVEYVRLQLVKSPNPWGFKDPRTCRLLPLWWEVFRDLNLEPVYVNAIRNPAEASMSMSKKSSVRKLSVANSELMWLSYNYDIARYVSVKSPAVMIDYDEWFADPVAAARGLSEALGIGGNLSSDELAECMGSIVCGNYRHHVEGKEGVVSGAPIVSMLYDAMAAGNPVNSAELRGHLKLVDLFFKSLAPVVNDLEVSTTARAGLEADKEQLSQREVESQKLLEELQAGHRQQSIELERLREEGSVRGAELARIERERLVAAQQVEAARGALEEAKGLATQAKAIAERQAQERSSLALKVATLEVEIAAEKAASEAELKSAREVHAAALKEAEAQAVAGRVALETEAAARAELLKGSIARQRKRNKAILLKAKEWRDAYNAEHGEDAARLNSADHAAELYRHLESTERRLVVAEDRNARFVAELEARDRSLGALRHELVERPAQSKTELSVFAWPTHGNDTIQVDGRIDRTDDRGIFGTVTFGNRPDLIPVVEVRINGMFVLAQSCLADEGIESTDGTWHFSIPWQRFSLDHEGKEAEVLVAGVGRELGKVELPSDLRGYHLSPAARAAELLGGTVAEAGEYQRWLLEHETSEDTELARTYRASRLDTRPTITVIVYGGDRDSLGHTIQSLRAQVYGEWDALCVEGAEDAEDLDPRVRTILDLDNAPTDQAGKLFTFVEAGDSLAPTALLHLAAAARANPDFALIYSDEDRIDPQTGLRAMPHMKPAWSPDLAIAQDYVTRLALVQGDKLGSGIPRTGSDVYGIALRAALSGSGPAVHLPFVLYHRAAENAAASPALDEAIQSVLDSTPCFSGARAVRGPEGRRKIAWPIPVPEPRVSLIVPTRDRADLLRVGVDGFLHETRYQNFEILIADNDSQEEETKTYLAKVATHPRVRVIPCPGPFNFSKINNQAAELATGSLIGLMNNDLKVLDPDWLREMVSHAVRPDVGIVGAKLLHGDGTIQHAGVTLGIGLASHLYKSFPRGAEGRQGRLIFAQDVSAVTAACLLMRRDVWDEVNGLDEDFPVAYNDVDLCLRVKAAGYRVVWAPDALVYHLESQSRGKDASPDKRERLNQDKARLMERWGEQLASDPYHSPNFSSSHVDCRLAFPPRVAAPWQAAVRTK